ncbi:hypothetical protein GCM10009633_01590 [Janibacter melonis]|uniref:DUF2231 domain-containing protein n=1 Tax=Janibacter melonis TaxID=262209 RepID=UPI001E503025|nr:DUF2231 domain-containing protein [Janibacter melonis]MCB5990115.1 hypothetical protein [Janibacter melonis]
MLDTVAGLPVHVLVIHAVVVLAPLAALAAAAYALVPRWRSALTWPTLSLAVVSALSAVVAASSGEALEGRLRALGLQDPALETHTQAGDLARTVIAVFAVVVVLAVLWLLPSRSGRVPRLPVVDSPAVALAVRVALVLVSLSALWFVVRAGHTGAQVAWSDVVQQSQGLPHGGE